MSDPTPTRPLAAGRSRSSGFELKLEQGRALVRLGDQLFLPGVRLADLVLEVPGVRFPFDVGAGAGQFRQHLCDLQRVELHADAAGAEALATRLPLQGTGLTGQEVALRGGFAELGGKVEGGPAFTVKVGVEPDGTAGLRLVAYAPRLYGSGPVAEPLITGLLTRAAAAIGPLDGGGLTIDPLPAALRRLLPPRGWKLPRATGARLTVAVFEPGRLKLLWERGGTAAEPAADPERLDASEGAVGFAAAEALLAAGDLAGAREAYLKLGPSAADHPFAAARLMGLLSADERFHGEALDLCTAWLQRRPGFPAALACQARIRAAAGDGAGASEAWVQLAAGAAKRGEELCSIAAADACLALGKAAHPAAAARAIEVALSQRRDHLPALRALLAMGERGGDRETLLRACRRLAAYSGEDAEKGAAHATLGRLLLASDPASARLHLDHALRLAPGQPETAEMLARACEEAGEPLRAVKAWDKARELRLAAGDRAGAARASVSVGLLWEKRLLQPENALLRYRDAADLVPGAESHERAAVLALELGHWAEAADRHAAVVGATDLTVPGAAARAARSRRALANIAETRLSDSSRAAQHLEAAVELEPEDRASLERLSALYQRLGRPADRTSALDRLAALTPEPEARAALLSEAARLALSPAEAQRRWEGVLELVPGSAEALRALEKAAVALGEGELERSALSRLARLPLPATEVAAALDRLAAAWEKAGGLPAALEAASEARRLELTPPRLASEVALAGRLGGRQLADVHAEQAEALAPADPAAAAASWLARARLLAGSDAELALAALAEARLLVPGDAEVLEAQAQLAEGRGDLSLALSALEELTLLRPEDGRLATRIARAALRAGDRELARAQAARAVELGADGAEELQAEVLAKLAEPDAAMVVAEAATRAEPEERIGLLRRALELDPESLAALRGLCADELAGLAGDDRAGWLARLADHPEAGSAESARALTARAEVLSAAGDLHGALESAREAARRQPGDPVALDRLAELAAGKDPAAAAEALLARATLAQERNEPDAALRLVAAGQGALAAGLADSGSWALREALRAGLDREDAAGAWQALAGHARSTGDAAAERTALQTLVPLLPTGEKPAALLRLGALHADAGDAAAAREAVELARRLAPRDPAAVEAALAAAEASHDLAAAAERLGELADLAPAGAGPRLLARARLLAGPLARPEEADDELSRAAGLLPPDLALAEEQVRLRRGAPPPAGERPWSEPLERLAGRLPEAEAAPVLVQAAELALQQGDGGAALRCARRAFERSPGDPALAGPLLGRLLYRQGSRHEAIQVLRRLLDEAAPRLSDGALVRAGRALAELAEEAGDTALARRALQAVLERRPTDAEAALALFRLEPDRRKAVNELAGRTEGWGPVRFRVRALARAAAAAHRELADPALADALWRRARTTAGAPALLAEVESLRAAALRADHDPADVRPPTELLEALGDAAGAHAAAGGSAEALALHEEAAELAVRHGLAAEELRQRRHLAGMAPGNPGRALELGLAAGRAGAWDEAADALELAARLDPDGPRGAEALAALPAALRATGDVGGAVSAARRWAEKALAGGDPAERSRALDEAVAISAELPEGPEAADALEPLAAALLKAGDPRGDHLAEVAVEALTQAGETARASALVALAARAQTGARRAAWLRQLASSAQARGDRAAALGALAEAVAAEPGDASLRDRYLALLEHAGEDAAMAHALTDALARPYGDRAALLAKLAKVRARLGDEAGAEAAERELVALGPDTAGREEAEASLERRWRERGDERALAELELRRGEAEPSSRGRARRLASAAEALLRAGAAEEARAAALRATEAEPDAPEPWRALAHAEAATSHPGEAAAAHLAAALRGDEADAAGEALEAARLFEEAGRDADAARACAAALAAQPGSPAARRKLAARAAAAGDLSGAARHLSALDRDLLPPEERPEHDRQLARALAAAGMPGAAEAWAGIFEADAGDAEAFDALASEALGAEDRERWLRLAARHDGALAAGDPARRRDLRCARAQVLAELGQQDAAEGAWHAALTLDPEHRPALAALRQLLAARGDAASAADLAAREASLARDPADAARLHLEEAKLRQAVPDAPRTAEALERAVSEALESPDPDAPAVAAEARVMLSALAPPTPLDEEPTARVAFREPEAALEEVAATPEPEPAPLPGHTTAPDFPPPGDLAEPPVAAPVEAEPPVLAEPAWPARPVPPPLPPAPEPLVDAELVEGFELIEVPPTPPPFAPPAPEPEARVPAAAAAPELPPAAAPEAAAAQDLGIPPGHTTAPDFLPPSLEAPPPADAPPPVQPLPVASDAQIREETVPGPGAWAMPAELLEPQVPAGAPVAEAPSGGNTVPEFSPLPEGQSEAERQTLGLHAITQVGPPPAREPEEVITAPGLPALADQALADQAAAGLGKAAPPAPAYDPAWEADPDPAAEARIRAFAEDASGAARVRALEALSRRLERQGDRRGAARAQLDAVASGPADASAVLALDRALELDPRNGPAAGALARALLALGEPARAGALLTRFEAGAEGLPALEVLELQLQAARAAGDVSRGVELALRAAGVAQDGPLLEAAAAALHDGGRVREALGLAERAAQLLPDGPVRAARLSVLARTAELLPAPPLAIWLWQRARAANPADPLALAALVRLLSESTDPDHLPELAKLAGELEAVAGADILLPHAPAVGRAFAATGDAVRAARWLEEAVSRHPADALLRRELEAAWAARPETADRALSSALERARRDPADPTAVRALAQLCGTAAPPPAGPRRAELGRSAASMAAFLEPGRGPAPSAALLSRVTPSLRARAALPEAAGPTARLLALLSPWLELLFPADLSRRGVRPEARLAPGQAPTLEARLAAAGQAFGGRAVVPFLAEAGGWDIALENTQPPSLVVGSRLVRELSDGALSWAVARALCLNDLGWSLIGKFAPADLGILCELACRFAGGHPPALGLPPQRAGAFLDALGRYVPATARERASALAAESASELIQLAPRDLQVALRRTASRQALLWTGDPAGALEALSVARRKGEADPRGRPLADPDLADLADFALSDLYVELRLEGLGSA